MKKIFPLLLVFLMVSISIMSVIPMGVDGELYDDFNDGNDDGWTPIQGTWEVRDNAYYTSIGMANSYSILDDSNFSNYTIEVKIKFAGTNVGFRQGIIFRYNSGNFYDYWISYEYQRLGICKHVNNDLYGDTLTPIYSVSFSAGVYYSLKIIVEGDCFEAYLDDIWMFTVYDDNFSYGEVGVIAFRTDAYFDDFSVSFISLSPTAILSASQRKIDTGDTVTFGGSDSEVHTGEISQYFFDYGDGHNSGWITEPIVSHTYATKGTFSARLKVMTSLGNVSDWSSAVDIFVDNTPPIASLIIFPSTILTYEATNISGASSYDTDGNVVEYYFVFGDDTGSGWISAGDVTHEYEKDGFYYIGLKVRDDDGLESAWKIITVIVKNRVPIPSLQASQTVIELGDVITFYAADSLDLDGNITKYYLDFGDGTNSGWVNTSEISHLYTTSGEYTVTLIVMDNKGTTSTSEAQLTIQANTPGLLSFKNPFIYFIIAAIIGIAIVLIIFTLKWKKIEK